MGDERDANLSEEISEDNDAREEDIVDDVDSDTRDIENTVREESSDYETRFSGIEATLERILGEISSLREAQGIMVENGAVITDETSDIGHVEEDEFMTPYEMDLLI